MFLILFWHIKILLAIGERQTALGYQSHLTQNGHVVEYCNTGEVCLEAFRKRLQDVQRVDSSRLRAQPFDVFILDCDLPDMDWLELGKKIRSLNPGQRIILLSGNIQDTTSRIIREFEMPTQVLQKPVSNQLFIASLDDEGLYNELRKFKTEITRIKNSIEIREP